MVASQCIRQLSAATVFAFYRYDKKRDQLTCEYTIGDTQGWLQGLNIALGTRVTGWCAATGRVSSNAAASLDLANVAELFDPPLRSVLCAPLRDADHLLGVLTAYSHRTKAFSENDLYPFEQIAIALGDRLRTISVVDPSRQLVFRPRSR